MTAIRRRHDGSHATSTAQARRWVFLRRTLTLWYGPISAKPVPVNLRGFTDGDDVNNEIGPYLYSVAAGVDYTGLDDRDLARLLFLIELAFGSDLLGGRGFATDTGIDERTAIRQLRWIRRKIST